MARTELFLQNEPVYQPARNLGFRYHEPVSRRTVTGWLKNGTNESVEREEVAAALGVSTAELLRWERATDLEAEEESRAEYGDY